MFDLAWSEIALIAVVAVVVIGPKDLPDAVRGVARMVRKARQMASEFRGQADELVREANLHEVRDSLNEIRNFNLKDTLEKTVDSDGTLRKTFEDDPLRDYPHTSPGDSLAGSGADSVAGTETAEVVPAPPPAFVPPGTSHMAEPPPPPAFIPPGTPPQASPAGGPTHNA